MAFEEKNVHEPISVCTSVFALVNDFLRSTCKNIVCTVGWGEDIFFAFFRCYQFGWKRNYERMNEFENIREKHNG